MKFVVYREIIYKKFILQGIVARFTVTLEQVFRDQFESMP